MIIEKNGKFYAVTETRNKWTVKSDVGKLSVVYDVSKEMCPTGSNHKKGY